MTSPVSASAAACIAGLLSQRGPAPSEADSALARDLVASAVRDDDDGLEIVTLEPGGVGGGASVKPKNLLLDLGKLFVTGAKLVLGIKGIVFASWTLPLVALVLWDDLYSRLKLDVDEREASVLWTLWIHRDEAKLTVPKEGLLDRVNAERKEHARDPLTEPLLAEALGKLVKMGCVEDSGASYRIVESVRVKST